VAYEAANGDQALAMLAAHADIDLLFTDVRMPGMSGVELATIASERWPALRVVLTSGYLGHENPKGFRVVTKPWEAKQLVALLPADAVSTTAHTPRAPKRHVLLVEDDEPFAYLVARAFEASQIRVSVVHRGLDAIEHDRWEPADLVLLDLRLPDVPGRI